METPNVNNLNGIPNFGYGLPADGIVIAGVTDVTKPLPELTDNSMNYDEEVKTEPTVEADVPAEESEAETNNG